MSWTLLSALGCTMAGGDTAPAEMPPPEPPPPVEQPAPEPEAPAPAPEIAAHLTMEQVPGEIAKHQGSWIEVTGLYRAVSSGDEWIRVILIGPDKDETLSCYTAVNGPKFSGLSTGTEIVVRGRVEAKRAELALVDCDRVMPPLPGEGVPVELPEGDPTGGPAEE